MASFHRKARVLLAIALFLTSISMDLGPSCDDVSWNSLHCTDVSWNS